MMNDFDRLVLSESSGLIAAVRTIVDDPHRAEEIVQDAFERCYLRWHRVSRLERPGAWVRRVAINRAISVGRRATVEQRALARVGHAGRVGAGADTTGIHALDGLLDRSIWVSVGELPPDQATAIALRYGADLGIDEIAETMKTTDAAVKSLLHRARRALRDDERVHQLQQEGERS